MAGAQEQTAALGLIPQEQLQDPPAVFYIQTGGGFIRQKQPRPPDNGPDESRPLPFAPTELPGKPPGAVWQIHLGQKFPDLPGRNGLPGQPAAEPDIFFQGQEGQQFGFLEHITQVLSPPPGPFRFRKAG